MPAQTPDDLELSQARARIRRLNRIKVFRTILQILFIVAVIALGIFVLIRSNTSRNTADANLQTSVGMAASQNSSQGSNQGSSEGQHFIAISYPGLTRSTSMESKIVNLDLFIEQLTALKDSGYVTISQNDIINYYLNYGALPEKALFIIFEDGLMSSVSLAQETLEKLGYSATLCTYANNLDQQEGSFVTGSILQSLQNSPYWEFGSNGYRLSYINVFDRYANFFGALNIDEFVSVREYLWRDYNHYLMDFIRDADRLRTESEAVLRSRIATDYDLIRSAYQDAIGYVPALYILMHSNTGAFATDAIASDANREHITTLFSMNVNREGTCRNTLDSSIYDLSRLQVQSYFSTNHMLMRIWDDTGDTVNFLTGDTDEAARWYTDGGVVQYKGNEIVLTSLPEGKARLTLKSRLFSDLDMTVNLKGNMIGRQSIYLRTDRNLTHGLEIALEDNELEIWSLGEDGKELYHQNLFELDGGPYISIQEHELNGLITLAQAIIQFDDDPARIAEATQRLQELLNTPVTTLADGGTPYYPTNDTADREMRTLRIRLVDQLLTVWIDGKATADQLEVDGVQIGAIGLGAAVFDNHEDQFTQHNIYDDVYDGVFEDLAIYDTDAETLLYDYRLAPDQTFNSTINGWGNSVVEFFRDLFNP